MCTDGEEDAERAVRLGGYFARGLDANVTVLHVSSDISPLNQASLQKTRKPLNDWISDVPGVATLDRAGKILAKMGLAQSKPSPTKTERFTFREASDGGLELHRVGRGKKRVRFKLREGETADEILSEAQQGKYDLVITGARSHAGTAPYFVGSTALRTAEFSPCSTLFAKNIKQPHDFLVCTDGSKHSETAELFSAKIAQTISAKVTVLSVALDEEDRELAWNRVRRAEMVLNQLGIEATIKVLVGRPSEVIIHEAKEHDIVVMGASGSSAVRRFFLGSVPLKVIEYGECPVLLVRGNLI